MLSRTTITHEPLPPPAPTKTVTGIRRVLHWIIALFTKYFRAPTEHFTPLSDEQAVRYLMRKAKRHYTEAAARRIVSAYRQKTREWNIPDSVPICWLVLAGFTLKLHAPASGRTVDNLEFLQIWHFEDQPTENCLVFMIPCLVPAKIFWGWCRGKRLYKESDFLADLRQEMGLPEHHLSDLGSVGLVAGLLLAHQKAGSGHVSSRQIPLNDYRLRTGTCLPDNRHLELFWVWNQENGLLNCGYWESQHDERFYSHAGFLALGVEEIGG